MKGYLDASCSEGLSSSTDPARRGVSSSTDPGGTDDRLDGSVPVAVELRRHWMSVL